MSSKAKTVDEGTTATTADAAAPTATHACSLAAADVSENIIRASMPRVLDILLADRSTSTPDATRNIIWANENYVSLDPAAYAATAQIMPGLITGDKGTLIMPRALKSKALQKERTRARAEVFTPFWVVKKQNDLADEGLRGCDLETYISLKWMEVACGEAPYMATRYDVETGELVPVAMRAGFVDRKLARINEETDDKDEWQRLVEQAYKACFGFEWNGDSLLLARENLLYTYRDYHFEKWGSEPSSGLFEEVATIISYNVFQMDGLKLTVPLTEKRERVVPTQLSLFESDDPKQVPLSDSDNIDNEWRTVPGKRARIMNWDTNSMEFFGEGRVRL